MLEARDILVANNIFVPHAGCCKQVSRACGEPKILAQPNMSDPSRSRLAPALPILPLGGSYALHGKMKRQLPHLDSTVDYLWIVSGSDGSK